MRGKIGEYEKYFREIVRTLPEIAEESGYSRGYITRSFIRCFFVHHVHLGVFRSLRLYNYTGAMLRRYLTLHQCAAISDRLNAGADEADIARLNDKHVFNTFFGEFVFRDWLYVPDGTPAEIEAFIAAHDRFLTKTCSDTRGEGITLYESAKLDPAAFAAELAGKPYLLEALIEQHPAMAAINASSVNTIRVITARKDEHVRIIGAGLRTGGGGQFVDNFHHGGTAYPIDLDTGIITGRGIDLYGNPVLRHPVSGMVMPGFCIPHWELLKKQVCRAAVLPPNVGYVGWDVAITPDGVELIEGNVNYPGTTIIQLDGPGPYDRLRELLAEAGMA